MVFFHSLSGSINSDSITVAIQPPKENCKPRLQPQWQQGGGGRV
uniref:Uncharacterized protein n=1 Tax=Anguilla anguilla TaxID=7936 RepID=A0A0E9PRT6_ANGAN